MKRVDETKAGQSISAFVIISPENVFIAKVQAHYSEAGRVLVNVWNWGEGQNYQEGSAGGYGYDKFTAAIRGMVIDGHELTDHCAVSLPKPEIFDAGSEMVICESVETTGGGGLKIRVLQDNVVYKTGDIVVTLPELVTKLDYFPHDFQPPAGYHVANWTDKGYADCYKESGLDYLKRLGYSVIQAI